MRKLITEVEAWLQNWYTGKDLGRAKLVELLASAKAEESGTDCKDRLCAFYKKPCMGKFCSRRNPNVTMSITRGTLR